MNKKVSLKDVARHVGVSTALVSYVINNKEKEARVGAEVAERIRKASLELNYQPNLLAKGLKSGKSNTIGLIVADISNPFFSNIARIVEDEAKKHGYIVIFGSSDESADKSKDLMNVLANRQVDAFIIAPAAHTEPQIKALQKNNIPFVLIDRYFSGINADTILIDNRKAAYKAVLHLIKGGRRNVAMVAYDTPLPHMQERINGYKDALKEAGIRFKNDWLVRASYQNIAQDVGAGMQRLLRPVQQANAIFFATNTLAIEGLKRIVAIGINVPDELAVIAFDESDAFEFFYSPITYVRQSVANIGKEAVNLILQKIKHGTKPPKHLVVEAKLIVRESCGHKLNRKNKVSKTV